MWLTFVGYIASRLFHSVTARPNGRMITRRFSAWLLLGTICMCQFGKFMHHVWRVLVSFLAVACFGNGIGRRNPYHSEGNVLTLIAQAEDSGNNCVAPVSFSNLIFVTMTDGVSGRHVGAVGQRLGFRRNFRKFITSKMRGEISDLAGVRVGNLRDRPYHDESTIVGRYCDDVKERSVIFPTFRLEIFKETRLCQRGIPRAA